ncbi:hydroxyacid dehydrogenase [Amorphus orientalis]|uniref:D-3-phosphoglycerate dehydrogenase n=1 Tax=Amorphus orientalis TaxID=649198 RepID=A0AAE3VRI2_9HYPH|nr:hydroxyacid dehydrogenase [Amorphus orientalis]MDQ0316865.1 D-3-phosphoglycerate dehydrogenase [Amorphus orientalis]
MKCLLIQPIHPSGIALLEEAGLEVVQASAHDMETVAREIVGADAAITRNAGLNRAAMEAGSKLQVLGNHGIGVDPVDVDYATEIGLPIAFTPYANVQSVAELVIAHMLAIAKRVRECDTAVRDDRFDYRYTRDFREVSGKTLLICGFGRIGRRTAEVAKAAFDMRILVHSPSVPAADIEAAGFVAAPDLDAALGEADYVSLHQTLTPRTRGLFSRERLFAMKKDAALINTARGALVDREALVEAVEGGHLRGAAFDVFETEPPPADHPYLACKGLVLSPHIGGSTEEAAERTAVQAAEAVLAVLNGKRPEHMVNPDVWERRRKVA